MIRRLAIIGVGLIGGSLARALRAAGEVGEVVGCGRTLPNLERALELGVIDRFTRDPAEAVRGADMVFLAVPLGGMARVLEAIRPHLPADAVVTDGGSVKGSVVQDAQRVFGSVPPFLVPGHPIAGTEHSGVEASFPELYRQRRVILTPLDGTDPQALRRVEHMWRVCGAEVTCMAVKHHDEVLAATSHLPHMLAFGLVDSLARMRANDEIFRFAAGGFRDFTRIASSNPVMWRDICLANRDALATMLKRFARELHDLADALDHRDGARLLEIFQRAKAARDRYVDRAVGNDGNAQSGERKGPEVKPMAPPSGAADAE
jgi:prephenate dehydrogenase